MPVEIVAEFTTNHLGNWRLLRAMIIAANLAGADSIKLQRKHVESCYSREKLDSPYSSPYGKTFREYRTKFELSGEEWEWVDKGCKHFGLQWSVTAQDRESLHAMVGLRQVEFTQLDRFKLSSTAARDSQFVLYAAGAIPTDCEVVVSVAGQTLQEIERIVNLFRDHRRLWILHCVAEYPCPPERLRLGNIAELRKHFACNQVRIGYSGHEVGYLPTLAAVEVVGAEMIERHFCMSRNSFAHHIECALEPYEFAAMVKLIRGQEDERESPFVKCPVRIEAEAYRTEFGMSEQERPFLEDQQYGR